MSTSKIQSALILSAMLAASGPVRAAAPTVDTGKIAAAIKADVDQLGDAINAHDAVRAAGHDAPDVVVMECGSPNVVGAAADLAGFKKAFASDPTWKIARVDEAVDVAASGDMAVYRATFVRSWVKANSPVARKANLVAGYKPQADGSWKMTWYVLSPMGPAQPAVAPEKR